MKTKLKICGIRSEEEIDELIDLNIDYFGNIFVEKSPRNVSVELAKRNTKIIHRHPNNKKSVGVFVDEKIDKIVYIINTTKIDVVQLHGDENIEYIKELSLKLKNNNLDKVKIWKVFRVFDKLPDIDKEYLDYIEYFLFDTKGIDYGGNGISFDWDILKNYDYPFVLAGGLSNENIEEALKYKPSILDVNSKVETDNRKNKKLIKEIIKIMERVNYE